MCCEVLWPGVLSRHPRLAAHTAPAHSVAFPASSVERCCCCGLCLLGTGQCLKLARSQHGGQSRGTGWRKRAGGGLRREQGLVMAHRVPGRVATAGSLQTAIWDKSSGCSQGRTWQTDTRSQGRRLCDEDGGPWALLVLELLRPPQARKPCPHAGPDPSVSLQKVPWCHALCQPGGVRGSQYFPGTATTKERFCPHVAGRGSGGRHLGRSCLLCCRLVQ